MLTFLLVKVQLKVGLKSSVWKSQAVGHLQRHKKLAVLTLMKALMVAVLCCHCSRLCCGYLRRLHNWNGDCWRLSGMVSMYSRPAVACVASGS